MAILKVNPEAESKSDFPTFQPGTYRMRIKAVQDRATNPDQGKEAKQDYKLTLEYVDATQLILENGTAYTGTLEGAGSLFDYVMQDPNQQWKLRQLTEAAGLPWVDYDPTVDLIGREIDVKVKTEMYEGEKKNKVGRYVLPK